MLNPLEKQAYKLELLRKDKIYDVFYMSLLEWHTTKKEWVDANDATKLDAGHNNSREYKMKAICNSVVCTKKSINHLYLIF